LQPGQTTTVWAEFMMHAGMGGRHLFVIKLKSNDPVEPERTLKIKSNWIP